MNTDTPNIISQTQSDFEEDQTAGHDSKRASKKDREEDEEGIEEKVVNPVMGNLNGCSDNNSVSVRSYYRRRPSISKTANKKQKMVPITKWFKVEHEQVQPSQNRRNDEIQIREDRKIAKSMHIEMLRDLCRNINK